MRQRYHAQLLAETLAAYFSPLALEHITRANVAQDDLLNQLRPELHFDNCRFAEALAYIEAQHRCLAQATDSALRWAAFGRLTHTAQDFYAHSNYVDLWLNARGSPARPDNIDGLDPQLLTHPDLRSGYFHLWRDFIYYLPGLKRFAKKYLVFKASHEALNLDDESRSPKFAYAMAAARQRTLAEYQRALHALNPEQIAQFHGQK